MSRLSLVLILVAGLFATALAGPATFADKNPIRQVVFPDELENGILQVVGQTRSALSFARFAIRLLNSKMRSISLSFCFNTNIVLYLNVYKRHRKRYDSVEEIKQRFEIFLDNLKMIRSHNRKGLSYKLGINGTILSYLSSNRGTSSHLLISYLNYKNSI